MLKIGVRSARARVRARYTGSGSVTPETFATGCAGIDTELLIESDDGPRVIANLARALDAGCFVVQTIRNPTPVTI